MTPVNFVYQAHVTSSTEFIYVEGLYVDCTTIHQSTLLLR
jgi:hypothetical protein